MNFFENAIIFDKYQIIEKINEDRVFTNYLGKNLDSGSKVFIKILSPDKYTRYEVDKICYSNELPVIKSFDHKNIMHVYEAGSYSNTICVVSEYVGSTSLKDYLDGKGALDISVSLKLIEQLAFALRYAHSKNILHRNLKTANIGIFEDNGELVLKVYDFGLSYVIDYGSTTAELVDENFGFMAPEATGLMERKVDVRSDLYSLGIILYRFVTGNFPFHADSIDSMVYQHVAVIPKDPTEYNPAIPEFVSQLIIKLLSKDPDKRYQTTNELINDIDMFLASNSADTHMRDEDLIQTMDQRSKLLSRKNELAQLRNYYTKALDGPGKFCLINGSLGCGKSDLISNLCNEFDNSNITYFRAHFSYQSMMTPYYAFHEILDNFADRFEKYDRKLQLTERSRLARSLMGLSDLIFRICPDMKKVLPESLALPTLEGFREQQRSVMLLANFFLGLHVQGKPFAIILDDIHYADAASLALLSEMAEHIKDSKIFIICSYRTEDVATGSYLSNMITRLKNENYYCGITLQPFDEVRMCEYLSDLLILNKDDCGVLASYVAEKTGGNPYFTVNVIRTMLEDGVISVGSGKLEQDWSRLREIIQDTEVTNIIQRRLSKFSPETLSLLEAASVIGDSFSLDLLGLVTNHTPEEITPLISEAINLQFLDYNSTESFMEFSHLDIHEFFLSKVSDSYKRELHLRIAQGLERLSKDISRDIYSIVYHFDAAGSDEDVRRYIMEAAAMARSSFANSEALTYYNRAVTLVGEVGCEDWCIAKSALVELNLALGNFDAAIETANSLLPHTPDNVDKARILQKIGLAYFRMSEYSKCEEMLYKALAFLKVTIPTKRGVINRKTKTMSLRLYIMLRGSKDISYGKNKPGDDTRIPRTISAIFETLCLIYAYSDMPLYIYLTLRMFLYNYEHFGPSHELATSFSAMSIMMALASKNNISEQLQLLAAKIHSSLQDPFGLAKSNFYAGLCLMWHSDNDRAIKSLQEARDEFESIGDASELNTTQCYLAQVNVMIGNYAEAEALAEKCIIQSEKLNDRFTLAMSFANLINCYTEMGNYVNAEEVAKRARVIVDELNHPYIYVVYANAYGRLLLEINKFTEAISILSNAKKILDSGKMSYEYDSSICAYLALARIHVLSKERSSLTFSDLQSVESDIAAICDRALAHAKASPAMKIIACRASALFGIISERYKRTEASYKMGAELIVHSKYYYENAQLDYEFGQYLMSKHRSNEARFYIFEAYMTYSNISSTYHMKACEQIIAEKYQEAFSNNALLLDVTARRNRMNVDRRVNTLLKLGDRLTSTLELEELQRKILQDAVELVGAERGILFLYPETGERKLYVASVYNLGSFDCNTYDWMLEEVERNRRPIVINDVQSDEYRKHYSVIARYGIKSVMAMPMFVRGALFGVIYLDSRLARRIFTEDYLEAMSFIANQAGAPIENARLYHRAITDGLTGIYGRSYLDNLIIDRTSASSGPLSAIMIDVDNFKHCNDTYGHPFGDKVLKQIAGIMKRTAGENSVSCRYGGEEFVVLLDSSDPVYALDIADKIRQTVENSTLAYNAGSEVTLLSVTISLGVSIWDPNTMERIDLIEHADKALYYAKQHGKNRAVLWSEGM